MRKLMMMGAALMVSAGVWGKVTTARIDEIAAWVAATPQAEGASIENRSAWNRLAATPEGKKSLAAAEKLLEQPVPEVPEEHYLDFTQNGNRNIYEGYYGKRVSFFLQLIEAECLEAKGRFIPKICEAVDALCALKSWVLPAHDWNLTCFNGQPHIDLCSAAMAQHLAFGYSWLGGRLPASTREKIWREVDRRVFQPYIGHARGTVPNRYHHWFHGGSNWNSVCNACVVRAALMMVPSRQLRAEFIAYAEETAPYALAGYTEDGYCSEGMGYWNYGYGHHLQMALAVRTATKGKVDLVADPKTKKVMEYAYGFQIQHGRSPHFADGGGNPSPVLLALGRQPWPDLVDSDALKQPLLAGGAACYALRAFGQEPPPAKPTQDMLPARSWFPDAQVLISRTVASRRPFGVAMKGGHNNELHNHNDLGSYTLMLGGIVVAGDPGGEVYTARTFSRRRYESKVLNSYGHPVPMVGGKLQLQGRQAEGKVLKTEFTDARDTFVLDYTSAYQPAVPALKSIVRTFVFDRKAMTYTVKDEIECTEPTAFEVPVITYNQWTKNDSASSIVFDVKPLAKASAASKPGKQQVEMTVSASAPVDFTSEAIENPNRPSPQRLAWKFAKPVEKATFTTVYRIK